MTIMTPATDDVKYDLKRAPTALTLHNSLARVSSWSPATPGGKWYSFPWTQTVQQFSSKMCWSYILAKNVARQKGSRREHFIFYWMSVPKYLKRILLCLLRNYLWPSPVWPAQPYVKLLNLLRPLKRLVILMVFLLIQRSQIGLI